MKSVILSAAKDLTSGAVTTVACLALAAAGIMAPAQTVDLHGTFLNPPDDAKPMMRWWWFGPAVTTEEIRHEIDQMHAGGIGGFELASVYPLALDDPTKGVENLRYASPPMVDMLRVAQEYGRKLGMRVDLTLGSGWPFGGPSVSIDDAAGRLKLVVRRFDDNTTPSGILPGDQVVAKFYARGTTENWTSPALHEVWSKGAVVQRYQESADTPHDVVLTFVSSHTKQMVKRAAVGGEGYVLDHMSRTAVDHYNAVVSDKLLAGFADKPPYAVFSDSLEVYGSDWTPTLPQEFKRRRGYDLVPHLPELWQGGTPQAEAVRHDWGVTLSDLVRENYLKTMADYAATHGTKFRSQTYGEPAATLRDELTPQLAEGEGPQWDRFSFTRWASSANHLAGRTVTSAETWTWLHSPAFRATPLDMKVEADRMFLLGVNQIVGHGWPYSPSSAQEPGYSLYAAAVFNAHNPWWPVMPSVMRYLQRVSWLLRQGEPANDVAILLPEDDAQAAFAPGHVSITEQMKERITPALMQAVLGSGHNMDFVDSALLETGTPPYRLIVVPPTRRMRLQSALALDRFINNGGRVIFVDAMPGLAPGLQDNTETQRLQSALHSLQSQLTASMLQLKATIQAMVAPDMDVAATHGTVGFIQRHLPDREVYFVANTSPEPRTFPLRVSSEHHTLQWWDIDSGAISPAASGEPVTLPPYGSRVLVASDDRASLARRAPELVAYTAKLTGWTAHYAQPGDSRDRVVMDGETSWPEAHFSGAVRYTTSFTAKGAQHMELRFAEGKPLPDTQPANKPGVRAWYDAPIREAASVFVNGKEAGTLWHPPYTLDISALTKPGENTLEIRVYNTAINALAAQPPRNDTALKAKYGDRFQMQDMEHLEPIPSGIFGPVEVVTLAPKP